MLSCVFLFAMMVVTFVDVVGRYVFLKPLPAGYEIVSLMMPAIIFLALPLSVIRNSHVTVDLLDSFTPKRFAEYRAIVISLICSATMALLAWRLAIRSRDQHRYEEVSDELILELWPFSAAMAALCAMTAVVFLVKFAHQIHGLRPIQDNTK
ncbi:TRAP dicarboxylate transporter, DctQ subunit, unknown substrate 3 [Candidatus Rhodobacter oscarellae]|uniref:TRAP transporter small permease protein n=1 Tax=Candidatus Rhodobacter oscarellae TaxID=1675527 RepID=A0A0J9E4M0_9RHOB|nr:TRAP dicarboxylate transporter, DctQ subunit, unknown substrate 3 [Candidatus Rhodobacter lobularis]